MRSSSYAPQTAEALIETIPISGNLDHFWKDMLELEENGEIIKTRFGTYGLPEKMGLVVGRFQLTSKGFGFVIPDNKGERPDVFIPPRALGGAMNNDRVMARVESSSGGNKPEGEIIRIITHANNKIVGIFHQSGDFGFVTPDDKRIGQDIYIMKRHFGGAKTNQKVVAEITEWPVERRNAEGKIIEILGNVGDVGLEILSIIKQNDLPLVIEASKRVPKSIKQSELEGRRDLRDLPIVTVDGDDAKDLDDAVYVKQLGKDEFLLGVHIADVSYYVKENAVLDKEARERGTSVYLVDRVLPMLPERLSNGICSLNAGEDRLTMSCEMHIDRKGRILSYEIFPSVIHVRHRLSYRIVREILVNGDEGLAQKYEDVVPMLKMMEELCLVLRKKRTTRGAIDFDLPEQKVILDEQGRPVEIVQRIRSIAESIIEEFMLAANETVARHMFNQKWPFIYRVHDLPNEEKMKDLAKLLANFNVKLKVSEETKPGEVQKALAEMAGKPEERLVSTVALRSLNPVMNDQKSEKLELNLDAIAEHSSIRERAAAEAERATVDLKKAEYMAGHIGEEFDGVISGVTAFGMFIELENGVEGLVHISSLMDDYYEFYEDRYALLGSHTRKVYRLGDPVRIEVLQVNIADRNIDFIMAGENDAVRDRIKAQLLGQRSHASARSAIEKSGGKKQGKSGSRKKPLEKRGKGGVGGNKYVNHAKSKKKGRKKK